MAAAKPVKQNHRTITGDPTFGPIIVQHQPITIEKWDSVFDGFVLRLAPLKEIRPQGLDLKVDKGRKGGWSAINTLVESVIHRVQVRQINIIPTETIFWRANGAANCWLSGYHQAPRFLNCQLGKGLITHEKSPTDREIHRTMCLS